MITTNLTPEQRAEMVADLEQLAALSEMAAVGENGTFHKNLAIKRRAAAAALANEAALAEQVRVLREALTEALGAVDVLENEGFYKFNEEWAMSIKHSAHEVADAALSLKLPEAARQAAENAEAAYLMDMADCKGWTIEYRGSLKLELRWLVRIETRHIATGSTLLEALRAAKEQPASRFDSMRNAKGETMEEVARRWDAENRAAKEAGK